MLLAFLLYLVKLLRSFIFFLFPELSYQLELFLLFVLLDFELYHSLAHLGVSLSWIVHISSTLATQLRATIQQRIVTQYTVAPSINRLVSLSTWTGWNVRSIGDRHLREFLFNVSEVVHDLLVSSLACLVLHLTLLFLCVDLSLVLKGERWSLRVENCWLLAREKIFPLYEEFVYIFHIVVRVWPVVIVEHARNLPLLWLGPVLGLG
jgi:hypothetical protein